MTKRDAHEAGLEDLQRNHGPSKVVHVRNLPSCATDDELRELCSPFGRVVQTKLAVGPKKNQAFVEFAELASAMQAVQYHGLSSEAAMVRGKTVYLQYSNRNEIVNGTPTTSSGNVLLATVEDVGAGTVTLEVLHLVFAAFGDVAKIATFEKTAGFQALVQYDDNATADAARIALDGRSIPRYLLPEECGACTLRLAFSAHTDLHVKFQSYRSRDFRNPALPVAPSAMPDGYAAMSEGLPPGQLPSTGLESNVLLANVENNFNNAYPLTVETVRKVFATYGEVQKIALFDKGEASHALVQYTTRAAATQALQALEGHAIYDGGYCTLRLSYSRHHDLQVKANTERAWDYTAPLATPAHVLGLPPPMPMMPPMGYPGRPPPPYSHLPPPHSPWPPPYFAAPPGMPPYSVPPPFPGVLPPHGRPPPMPPYGRGMLPGAPPGPGPLPPPGAAMGRGGPPPGGPPPGVAPPAPPPGGPRAGGAAPGSGVPPPRPPPPATTRAT